MCGARAYAHLAFAVRPVILNDDAKIIKAKTTATATQWVTERETDCNDVFAVAALRLNYNPKKKID